MSGPDAVVRTDRFVLEPMTALHAELLFDDLLDARLYTYIPEDPPPSVAQLRGRYQRWSARRSADGSEIWFNYALRSIAEAVYVGTLQATLLANGDALIAYQVFPRFWRTNVATESVSAMLPVLAASGAKRFLAHVDTRNVASQRLLAALGFSLVRRIENADFFKGAPSDELVFERTPVEREPG